MPILVGIGGENGQLNSSNTENNEGTAYKVEVKFSTAEYGDLLFWKAAEKYLEMFGLFRTDEVLNHWSMFF